MAKDKLRYVKGFCELEDGIVRFVGGMSGVSDLQTWYYIIYAIKDRFPKIDYWIDPKMEICQTLPSTLNHLRYGICQSLKCTFEKFPNGEIKPKLKLNELAKQTYKANRARIAEGVIPVLEFEPVSEPISSENILLTGFTQQQKNEKLDDNLNNATAPTEVKLDSHIENDTSNIDEPIIPGYKKRESKIITDTNLEINETLNKIIDLSHKLFSGNINIDKYTKDIANDIETLETLATTLEKYSRKPLRGNLILLNHNVKESMRKIAHCFSRTSDEDKKNAFSDTSLGLTRVYNKIDKKIKSFPTFYTHSMDDLDDINCQFEWLETYKKELTLIIDSVGSITNDALVGNITISTLESKLKNILNELDSLLREVDELDRLYLRDVHIGMATNIHVPITWCIKGIEEYGNDNDFSKVLDIFKDILNRAKDLYAKEGVDNIYLKDESTI